jgi:hypothetical protein
MPRNVVQIGVGNELRGNGRAGLETVRRVRERQPPASVTAELHAREAVGLLELWAGPTRRCSSRPCGQAHHRERSTAWTQAALPCRRWLGGPRVTRSAIELARSVRTLGSTILVYGVEGCPVRSCDRTERRGGRGDRPARSRAPSRSATPRREVARPSQIKQRPVGHDRPARPRRRRVLPPNLQEPPTALSRPH